mmetsp:Transcript_31819/g.95252  ORF Transcript_31819/g.95252 Transcript_31819/m.95252 type:complete len:115 (+) Transcript_31819:1049-1393(+)
MTLIHLLASGKKRRWRLGLSLFPKIITEQNRFEVGRYKITGLSVAYVFAFEFWHRSLATAETLLSCQSNDCRMIFSLFEHACEHDVILHMCSCLVGFYLFSWFVENQIKPGLGI